jgi:mannose-1-phosphate guanylyltransferase
VERIIPEIPFDRIMVVTGKLHANEIKRQLPELTPQMIVTEPQGKNTAACVALAAYKILKSDPDAVMAVLPADHLIKKEEAFLQALKAATQAAFHGDYLITFGVLPDRPETGYGYIELGSQAFKLESRDVFKVARFVEKPDSATAEMYVATDRYLWNSGMFVWKAATIVKALQELLPSVNDPIQGIVPALNTPNEADAVGAAYKEVESISVDYGILEKADNVLTMPIDVGWDDVGSWASLDKVWDCDEHGNATKGRGLMVDSKGCIVSSPQKVAIVLGVDGLIVVDTPDALMVCRKDRAQDVRRIQEILKERGYEELL